MSYSEMVSVLKSTIDEDDTQSASFLVLEAINAIRATSKKAQPELENAAENLQSHITACAQHRWGVYNYFTGQGPVARKLKDYAAITSAFSMGSYKLQDHIKKFDFGALIDDAPREESFRAWLEEITINILGKDHDLALPLPYSPGIEIGFETGIHIHRPNIQYTEEDQSVKWLCLAANLENGVKCKFVVREGGDALLLYWHPHEEVWLADGAGVLVPGVWDELRLQWDSIADRAGYTSKPIDIVEETNALIKKADLIFEKKDQIPEVTEAYLRNGEETYIRFAMEHYHLIFTDIGGKWPSRYWTISINMGDAHSTTIGFEDMREFARQELIQRAHKGLDSIIKNYCGEGSVEDGLKDDDEVPATPNFGNPVWRVMNQKAGK